jgi:TatA/E family protein of Tat protein translocase
MVVVVMLFGAKPLPEVGRSLGTGLRGCKHGLEGREEPENATDEIEAD